MIRSEEESQIVAGDGWVKTHWQPFGCSTLPALLAAQQTRIDRLRLGLPAKSSLSNYRRWL